MKTNKVNLLFLSFTLLLSVFLIGCGNQESSSEAGNYPTKPVQLYVPANPGGGTDASARILQKYMQEYLGEELVIINEAGGGGTIATDTVRNSEPDGYNLLFFHQAFHTGKATNRFDYDATALKPIGTYSAVNMTLAVRADSPWSNLEEFVEDAKQNPGKYKFGAQFSGTTHFHAAMLEKEAGIDIDILDGGTGSERMAALLGGHIDMTVASMSEALQYTESGDFKILAVMSDEPDPLGPDFPTAIEQGYNIVLSITHTLYGPKDIPENVVQAWNAATERLAQDEDYNNDLTNIGQVHILKDSSETSEWVEKELNTIVDLGKELGF